MIKIGFKLFIFISLLFVTDILVGKVFTYLLTKQIDGRFYKIKYSLDHSFEDIIIIGSSRGETNYNPNVFSKVLSMNCWNASRGGQSIPYFITVGKEILSRYSPKIIILNLETSALEGQIDNERVGILRPFTNLHKHIHAYLSQINRFEKYKLKSNIYINNSVSFYFFRPFFLKNKDGSPGESGWKPQRGKLAPSIIPENRGYRNANSKQALNPDKVLMFNGLVELAHEKKSKIIVVFSPEFPIVSETATMEYIKLFSKVKNYYTFDFSRNTTFTGKLNYFFDEQHMNDDGANVFSYMIANEIQKYLNLD